MGGRYERVALVTDVRGQESFAELFEELDKLEAMGVNYSILYMEATEASLIQRYKESRRPHPLADECGTIQDCVQREIELTRPVRATACSARSSSRARCARGPTTSSTPRA